MHSVSRSDVEDFLFAEADLLDQWRLPEWLTLFTDDAKYEVPCTDLPPDASPDTNLFYIADDRIRLGERVKRLMKRTAHVGSEVGTPSIECLPLRLKSSRPYVSRRNVRRRENSMAVRGSGGLLLCMAADWRRAIKTAQGTPRRGVKTAARRASHTARRSRKSTPSKR